MADHELSKGAKRQNEYEKRMKEGGYKRLCFWVHEEDEAEVKDAVNAIVYREMPNDG